MAMRTSAKVGDFKQALENLKGRGGYEKGTPESLPRKLGFDGGWKEFRSYFRPYMSQTEIGVGVFAIALPGYEEPSTAIDEAHPIDPNIYAKCAANYLIGDGSEAALGEYNGRYEDVPVLIGELALEVAVEIGGIYLPPDTLQPLPLYTEEMTDRMIVYHGLGERFKVYGREVHPHNC